MRHVSLRAESDFKRVKANAVVTNTVIEVFNRSDGWLLTVTCEG